MSEINNQKWDSSYLNGIKNEVFTRMDQAGNGDGKVTIDEAFEDLDIGSLLSGQSKEDCEKIFGAAQNINDVLAEYAGADGIFSPEEWAEFLNGDEWGSVMDAWHSSGKKAELEMNWIDDAHIKDGKVTKGEIKVGIFNNIISKNQNIDTKELEDIIDKYAGDDGTFSKEEYMKLRQDPLYNEITNQFGALPWFNDEE